MREEEEWWCGCKESRQRRILRGKRQWKTSVGRSGPAVRLDPRSAELRCQLLPQVEGRSMACYRDSQRELANQRPPLTRAEPAQPSTPTRRARPTSHLGSVWANRCERPEHGDNPRSGPCAAFRPAGVPPAACSAEWPAASASLLLPAPLPRARVGGKRSGKSRNTAPRIAPVRAHPRPSHRSLGASPIQTARLGTRQHAAQGTVAHASRRPTRHRTHPASVQRKHASKSASTVPVGAVDRRPACLAREMGLPGEALLTTKHNSKRRFHAACARQHEAAHSRGPGTTRLPSHGVQGRTG